MRYLPLYLNTVKSYRWENDLEKLLMILADLGKKLVVARSLLSLVTRTFGTDNLGR